MKDALCRAFCDALTVREIPDGLAVGTPFRRGGDALGFYIINCRQNRAYARLEDDGQTISLIEASGVNLSVGSRAAMLGILLSEFGIQYDTLESVLHTPFVRIDEIPALSLKFIEFLVKMQDFAFFTRTRVEDTFRSDVILSVMERFSGRAEVELEAAPNEPLMNHVADVVIRPPERAPLALYVGDSNNKALEAVVLQQKTIISDIMCNVMLVVREAKPKRVQTRVLAIVHDDKELAVAVYPDDPEKALKQMERLAFGLYGASYVSGTQARN